MKTIGLLGGGQLGRMLALAGYPLGLQFRVFEPTPAAPTGQLAPQIVADYADHQALKTFAAGVDVITYEFENVPVAAAHLLNQHVPVLPPPRALEVAQDRLFEKQFFQRLGIGTPVFVAIDSRADLDAAVRQLGTPTVLKTRRMGYDGKGQIVIEQLSQVEHAWQQLGDQSLILEGFVAFRRELSLLAVRAVDGSVRCYPLVENQHSGGILRRSRVPAPNLLVGQQAQAEQFASALLTALDYVGVLAIELFELPSGELLANEIAPRVHNSGHWSIEGAVCSQFENHLRAITGLPLGATALRGVSIMHNLIGEHPDLAALGGVADAHIHLYGKAPRPGRKIGHITLNCASEAELEAREAELLAVLSQTHLDTKGNIHEAGQTAPGN
jgi:5-(carboxyamino)imidazole ribonucleotide synthase